MVLSLSVSLRIISCISHIIYGYFVNGFLGFFVIFNTKNSQDYQKKIDEGLKNKNTDYFYKSTHLGQSN